MQDLSLHVLDIVENSIYAGAKNIEINVVEDKQKDLLEIKIIDDGEGMDKELLENVLDPFVTTKKMKRVGLGLPLLAQATKEAGGNIIIISEPGIGTSIKATFQYSHIDRKPIGDMTKTLSTLLVANPDINFLYYHKTDKEEYVLDTKRDYY